MNIDKTCRLFRGLLEGSTLATLCVLLLSITLPDTAYARGSASQTGDARFFVNSSRQFLGFNGNVTCAQGCHTPSKKTSLTVTAPTVAHNATTVNLTVNGLANSTYYWRYRVGTSGSGTYVSSVNTGSANIGSAASPNIQYCIAERGTGSARTWNCNDLTIQRSAAPPPPNQAPVIQSVNPNGTITVEVGATANVTVAATDPDGPDADLRYFQSSSNTNRATVTSSRASNGQSAVYAITGKATGSVTVTATVRDKKAGSGNKQDSAQITVNVVSGPPPKTPPSINNIADKTVTLGAGINDVPVTVTDDGPGPFALVITENTNSAVASASITNGNAIKLGALKAGSTNITVRATDSDGLQGFETFKVTVLEPTSTNQPPSIAEVGDQIIAPLENRRLELDITDEDQTNLSVKVDSNSSPLTLLVVPSSPTSVTLTGLLPGVATVTLSAKDGEGLSSDPVTFKVTVASTNNPPVIESVSPSESISVNTGQKVQVSLNVTDENLGAIKYNGFSIDTGIATISDLGGGKFEITGQAVGKTEIELEVEDDAGGTDDTTVDVTVTQSDSAPIAVADAFVFDFRQATQSLDVLANDSDPEGSSLSIGLSASATALGGDVVVDSGQVIYTPPATFSGQDSFSYRAKDEGGQLSAAVQVTVTPSDTDADGSFDNNDNCLLYPNEDQADNDGDNIGNACDPDPDGDGEIGEAGNPFVTGKSLVERVCLACHSVGLVGAPEFGDNVAWAARVEEAGSLLPLLKSVTEGKGEMPAWGTEFTARELTQAVLFLTGLEDPALSGSFVDRDLDGVDDLNDNCINHPNSSQSDGDGDGTGDACEPDLNGDGVLDYSLSFVIFQETPSGRVTGGITQAGAGEVTVLVRTRAGIEGLSYDWSGSDPELLALFGGAALQDVVKFTPGANLQGVFNLVVSVQGAGIRGTTRARLVVVTNPAVSNLADTDYDGYPAEIDNDDANANRVLTDNNNSSVSSVFYSDQSITLGEFAAQEAAASRYTSTRATLTEAQFLNAAAAQYPAVTPVTDPSIRNSIGIMDFELRDLDTDSANIRLKLLGNIPLGAGLRIYRPQEGRWLSFSGTGSDSLASAPAVAGDCPVSNSNNYSAGLIAGQTCVRFRLTDGGPNDADGQRDGVISMIGAIGTLAGDQGGSGPEEVDLTPAKSGGGSMGWGLMVLVLMMSSRRYVRKYRFQSRRC